MAIQTVSLPVCTTSRNVVVSSPECAESKELVSTLTVTSIAQWFMRGSTWYLVYVEPWYLAYECMFFLCCVAALVEKHCEPNKQHTYITLSTGVYRQWTGLPGLIFH